MQRIPVLCGGVATGVDVEFAALACADMDEAQLHGVTMYVVMNQAIEHVSTAEATVLGVFTTAMKAHKALVLANQGLRQQLTRAVAHVLDGRDQPHHPKSLALLCDSLCDNTVILQARALSWSPRPPPIVVNAMFTSCAADESGESREFLHCAQRFIDALTMPAFMRVSSPCSLCHLGTVRLDADAGTTTDAGATTATTTITNASIDTGTDASERTYPCIVFSVKNELFVGATTAVRGAVGKGETEAKAVADLRSKLWCMGQFVTEVGQQWSRLFPEPSSDVAKVNLWRTLSEVHADFTIEKLWSVDSIPVRA